MEAKRCRYGFVLAGLGAGALAGALWLPWYRFHVGAQAARELGVAGAATIAGDPFTRFVRSGGSLSFTGWQLIGSSRIVIVLVGALIAALALAGIAGAAHPVLGKAVALFAFVGLVAAGEHMIFRPGPASVLSLRWGAFVALAGAGVALVGGGLAQPPGGGSRRRPPRRGGSPRGGSPRPIGRPPARRRGVARSGRHLRPVQ